MSQADPKATTQIDAISNALGRGDVDGTLDALGLTRRGVLATLAGGVVTAAGAPVATAGPLEADPVFEAIEAHKATLAAERASMVPTMSYPPADLEAEYEAILHAIDDAWCDLCSTLPTTAAGRDAWLEHIAGDAERLGNGFYCDSAQFAAIIDNIRAALVQA